MNRLRPYLKTYLVVFVVILAIAAGTYWGVKTWGMKHTNVEIDWVSFIKFNGVTYMPSSPPVSVAAEDLVSYDEVRFMVAGNVRDPYYRSKNGDAGYLPRGTPVYSVAGYSPLFRLWAAGILFEADTSPRARKGSDLLDIGGKVDYIDAGSPGAVKIRTPDQVSAVVDMVLDAPVDQTIRPDGWQTFVYFHLKDGTTVTRAFWPEQGQLSRGIMLPKKFWETLEPVGDGSS